jgi:hypothetical protein
MVASDGEELLRTVVKWSLAAFLATALLLLLVLALGAL